MARPGEFRMRSDIAVINREKTNDTNYLELIAKGGNSSDKVSETESGFGKGLGCASFFLRGADVNGHSFAKALYCGREWCSYCREHTHKRRMARVSIKYECFNKGIGYLVFTLPPEVKKVLFDVELSDEEIEFFHQRLSRIRVYLKKKLERLFDRQLRSVNRWHWYGDDQDVPNPHFNVLVDTLQYVEPEKLDKLKEDYRLWLQRAFHVQIAVVDIHYQYIRIDDPLYQVKKWHKLKYVLRPTFLELHSGNRWYASLIKGYRNSTCWGRWSQGEKDQALMNYVERNKKKEVPVDMNLVYFAMGICPICQERIIWEEKVVNVEEFNHQAVKKKYGCGFFLVI